MNRKIEKKKKVYNNEKKIEKSERKKLKKINNTIKNLKKFGS